MKNVPKKASDPVRINQAGLVHRLDAAGEASSVLISRLLDPGAKIREVLSQ